MKKNIIIAVVIFIYLTANGMENQQFDTTKYIAAIRKLYKECNDSIHSFSKKEAAFYEESTEGGQLIAYYSKDKLRKVTVTFMGETGSTAFEYYFHENKLYFAFYTKEQYDRPFYEDGRKLIKKEEHRFYFYENTLIRWIDDKGKFRNINTDEFKQKEREILLDISEFLKKIPNN